MSMDKGKAIESALLQIEKKFGKGAIMRLGERPQEEIGAISTNCLSLDAAIGVGGFPRGRIVEVYGPESSGKTTLALTVVASMSMATMQIFPSAVTMTAAWRQRIKDCEGTTKPET